MNQTAPVHEVIRSWARRDPERPAIQFRGQVVSYGELDAWSDGFAASVVAAGGKPGDLVGVIASRSAATVACFLGILKAGATCLPIFAGYPEERIRFILADASQDLACIFCDEEGSSAVPANQLVFRVEDVPRDANQFSPQEALEENALAYVLYTSGSTGAPKGVMITHSSLRAAVMELIRVYEIGAADRVLHCAPLGFDTSISEITRALCAGACLVIAPTEVTSSPSFLYRLTFLEEEGITRAVLPAALLRSVRPGSLPNLGVVVTTGEACNQEIVDRWVRKENC